MNRKAIVGILGGMGPEATNWLCSLITQKTPAKKDQDHIPVITFNNCLIPDRVLSISGEGPSPVPELVRTARLLEQAGAAFIAMPCNTAHLFHAEIQCAVSVPILDMIEICVADTVSRLPRLRVIGVLGSAGTVGKGLYKSAFGRFGIECLMPDERLQETVSEAIRMLKSGEKDISRQMLVEASTSLCRGGAEAILAGCTEISLVLTQECMAIPVPLIDPLDVLAVRIIDRALGNVDNTALCAVGNAGAAGGLEV